MTSLSKLSRAITDGRKLSWRPQSRAQVLERLLVKRAEARQAGLDSLEKSLRDQIAWALPVHREPADRG
jgi:hypothetical protein